MFKIFTRRLQNQLIPAFVLVLVVAIVPIILYNLIIVRQDSLDTALEEEEQVVKAQADEIALQLDDINEQLLFISELPQMAEYAQLADSAVNPAEICNYDTGQSSVEGTEALCANLFDISQIFSSFAINNEIYDQVRLLDANGFEIVRVNYANNRVEVVSGEGLQDKATRPYFSDTAILPTGNVYISPLNLNVEQGVVDIPYKPVLRYGTPIYEGDELKGVIVLNVLAEFFFTALEVDDPNDEVYLIDTDGTYLVAPDENLLYGRDLGEPELTFANRNPDDFETIFSETSGAFDDTQNRDDFFTSYAHVEVPGQPQIDWVVIHQQPLDNVLATVNEERNAILTIGAIAAIFGVAVAILVTRGIVRPINRLSGAARQISEGDLYTEIPRIQRQDEIGDLRQSFTRMSEEVRTLYTTLEDRVEAATNNLQTVFDVSNQVSTILQMDRLLQDLVDLTKERFRLYHAHIYLLEEYTNELVLTSGAGHVGRQMVSEDRRITLNNQQSIVARAARTRHSIVVNDVNVEGFLPNPLLPDTNSELAIPLIARGQVLGVLDVQNTFKNYFTDEIISIMELLGTQVASAISNAQLFETTERASRHEQALGKITERLQDAVSIDEILQVSVRELGKALRIPYTAIRLSLQQAIEAYEETEAIEKTDEQEMMNNTVDQVEDEGEDTQETLQPEIQGGD